MSEIVKNPTSKEAKIASFKAKQVMSYDFKKNYARIRAQEFYRECAIRDMDCHVSIGGLDSITLFFFLKSIGIKGAENHRKGSSSNNCFSTGG